MKLLRRLFGCVTLLVAGHVGAALLIAQEPIDVSNTQEILITSVRTSERFRNKQKGDEALVIRDRAEIAKLVNLFQNNIQGTVHACGYHWRLTFFRNGNEATEIFFNEECEEFERNTELICQLVQDKFKQTVNKPNSFVSNLEVDVAAIPETAKAELSRGSLRVLGLSPVRRLPYVELRAASTSAIPADKALWNTEKAKVILDADQALVNDIARIRQRYDVVEVGEIMRATSMFGGGKIEEERRVRIYFKVGADMSGVVKVLNKSKVGETVKPETYSLQILTPTRLGPQAINDLTARFAFIKAVSAYR